MNQARRISQAVSVAPVMIVLIILFMGGLGIGPTTLGSWFFVTEDFQYTDADSDALSNLVEKSHYNYYFEETITKNEPCQALCKLISQALPPAFFAGATTIFTCFFFFRALIRGLML